MTAPFTIKHEKWTVAGLFCCNNLRAPFQGIRARPVAVTTMHENGCEREYCVDHRLSHLEERSGLPRTWGNFLEQINKDQLQRYFVNRLQRLVKVTRTATAVADE